MNGRLLAAIALAAAWLTQVAPPPAPVQVPVYTAGEQGYHTFRIPSAIVTRSGAILAFAEGRRAGAADAGDIDLVLKRSGDGGATWSPVTVVVDAGPDTVGNPCPVLDERSGAIVLLTTRNRGDDRESQIVDGTSRGTRTVWVSRSVDDGRSWSPPREITSMAKRPDWTWYATGPGIGIQLSSGRLLVPANHAVAGTRVHRSHAILSDDGGETWRIGGISSDGTNESQAVELADGTVLLNMRNHPPRPENSRMVARSRDGGETFEPAQPDPALIEPPAQASLVRMRSRLPARADGARQMDQLLLFANPASRRRERLMVRVSADDGRSWPIGRVVHEGPAAYSSLVVLDEGAAVGLLYERGTRSPYETIAFARLSAAWLLGGRDWAGERER